MGEIETFDLALSLGTLALFVVLWYNIARGYKEHEEEDL